MSDKSVKSAKNPDPIESPMRLSQFDLATETLIELIRARITIIYIISNETEKSLLSIIHNMCERGTNGSETRKELFAWNCVDGFGKVSSKKEKIITEEIKFKAQGSSMESGSTVVDPASALDFVISNRGDVNTEGGIDHVYVLSEFHHYLREPIIQRRLRNFAEQTTTEERKILIMISTKNDGFSGKIIPIELENIIHIMDWPYPDTIHIKRQFESNYINEYNKIFKQKEKKITLSFGEKELSEIVNACKGMTMKQIDEGIKKSIIKKNTFCPQILSAEKKQIIKKSGSCEYIESSEGLSSIGGLDELKNWISERKASLSDDALSFGCDLPKGVLCIGPWGSGKTTTAKAIIKEWGLPGIRIDVSKMFGMHVGESENKTKQILDLVDSIAPCVLWWDEVENILTDSSNSHAGTDGGTTSRVLGLISTWMSEHEGMVFNIFTANDISNSPPKLFRKGRLDEIFIVDLPVKEERMEIFRIHLKKRLLKQGNLKLIDNIDFDILAEYSQNFSGAEIENTISSAFLHCFNRNKKQIETNDILQFVKKCIPMACTMRERILAIREWQDGRAIKASKYKEEAIIQKDELMRKMASIESKGSPLEIL